MSLRIWHPIRLRVASLLGVALLFYAAMPHVHGDHSGAPSADESSSRNEREAADGPRLLEDDAHESHSPEAARDDHPCTLCRDETSHESTLAAPPCDLIAALAAASDPIARSDSSHSDPAARQHPARAPPRA